METTTTPNPLASIMFTRGERGDSMDIFQKNREKSKQTKTNDMMKSHLV